MNKKQSMNILLFLLAIVLMVCVGAGCLFVFEIRNTLADSIDEKYETSDIKEYGFYHGHIEGEAEGIGSGLFIFPKKISSKATDKKYYYRCGTAGFDNFYEIILECTYDQESYDEEIERLTEITCEVRNKSASDEVVINKIEYSEEKFKYPAYITVYASHDTYEYALCDEETKRIIYVYMQMSNSKEILQEEYLPIEYSKKSLLSANSWENTNIYYYCFDKKNYINFKD